MPRFGRHVIEDDRSNIRGRSALPSAGSGRRDADYIRAIISGITEGASAEYLGAPPQVLELTAYTGNSSSIGHLYKVPVVIENLNITYPSDVDYIPTDDPTPTPMPTIMNVDINLVETQSPTRLANFSLTNFRLGILDG